MKTIRQTATIRGATPHDRKIVQTWRRSNWEKGVYSKATYGETSTGWRVYYCDRLRKQFGDKRPKK